MLTLSPSKLHSLLLELNNHPVDVMLLCETWHDADLVAIRRLRAEGYSVVERARPRTRRADESLGVNIIATAGVRLSPVNIGRQPTTFECVAARVLSGSSLCVVIVVHRTGLGTYHCHVLRRASRHPGQPGDVRRSHCPRR